MVGLDKLQYDQNHFGPSKTVGTQILDPVPSFEWQTISGGLNLPL